VGLFKVRSVKQKSLAVVGRKAVEMVDETQFKHPEIASFDDELTKQVDYSDEYDELVPKLPRYEVHKFGKNIGYTLVSLPIQSISISPFLGPYRHPRQALLVHALATDPLREALAYSRCPEKDNKAPQSLPPHHSHSSTDCR
jgi:hypothetical protein